MKIAIMGAMLEEIAHLKSHIKVTDVVEKAGREYICGTLDGCDVVLVFSRWGKVASASTTTTLIESFGVEFIIFTGVAGAVDTKLNIGDIVIANGLYQHDMDAQPMCKRFEIPLIGTILFEPKQSHVNLAKQSAEQFLEQFDTHVDAMLVEKYQIHEPKVYEGIIASGDMSVRDPLHHENLKFPEKSVLAVEMEGASVAQICSEYQTPYIIIRTISDKADHSASIDFLSFVADVASHYSMGMIRVLVPKLNN